MTFYYSNQTLSPALKAAGTVMGSVVISVGLFGNVLLFISIILTKQLRRRANAFIASLAISYLIPLLTVFPLYVHTYRTGYWAWGEKMCLLTFMINSGGVSASIVHMIFIAFYRYAMIVHPVFYRKLEKMCVVVILIILAYVGPYTAGITGKLRAMLGLVNQSHSFAVLEVFCVSLDGTRSTLFVVALFVGMFLFIAYFYFMIYWVVRKSRKRVTAENKGSTNKESGLSKRKVKAEVALMKVMLVTFLLYTVSYIPWPLVWDLFKDQQLSGWLWLVLNFGLWSSCSTTWLVYGLMNPQFRTAYRAILTCKIHSARHTAPTQAPETEASKF